MGTTSSRPQLTPEILVPRLGDYLVEKGLISAEDLKRALALQQSLRKDGQFPPQLGQVLISMNLLTREELDQAITEQILQLREALQRNNQMLEQRVKERTYELEQALSKLSELTQLKANFIANISHELRTPLTHLKGYLELFLTGAFGNTSADQNQVLEIMKQSSDRLEQLIEDLILFSTAERGQINLKIQPVHMADLAKQAIQRVNIKAGDKKINIELLCPASLPAIKADPEKLSWVIQQLLDNAIKFTAAGGQVRLLCKQEGKLMHIGVIDTGIGIPQDRLGELFEPFHQLDGSSTRRYGGTGLGLALVKKIIEAHGSTVLVKSEVGKGSSFEFNIPIQS
ncbi:MAG: HAMP domain-containing histidine kinase [Anaerolineae bacterium]|nr:HAMP domain-containing histidine kinase [Anaerolineae bacterium]